MKQFTEYVPASQIWSGAQDFVDEGYKPGLVRGYNVEVKMPDGTIGWDSCCYVHSTPESYFLDDFYSSWLSDLNQELTGRICFRGYGIEEYDLIERECYINSCDAEGNLL